MENKNRFFLLIVFGLILNSANEALACGSCGYIQFDRILPQIWYWVAFSVLWFFSLSIYTATTSTKLWSVYKPVWSLILVSVLLITSIMFIGPVFLLLLNLPGIILVFKAFLPNKSIPKKEKRNLKILSLAGIACLSFLIAITVNIRRERTDADFILKYEYSGPAKMACNRLVLNAPAQLNEIREIISKAKNSHVVAIASEGIGNHGDPGRDVPLLIDAYARIYGEYEDEKVELALSKLTGLRLPDGSSPSAWKKQLAAKAK